MAKKPQALDLYARATDLIDGEAARNDLYSRMDNLYDQTRAPMNRQTGDMTGDAASSVQEVRMPYATNVVDLVTDLADQMTIALDIPAMKDTLNSKRDAEDQEAWLKAWHSQNEIRQQRNLTADAAWLATQRGVCVARTLYHDKAFVKGVEGYTVKNLPIILQVRDPMYCFWDEGVDGLDCMVEQRRRKVSELRLLYPDVVGEHDAGSVEKEWTEVWTDTYRAYFIDSTPVKVKGLAVVPHGYGCVPYAVGVARSTPRTDPGKRFRPLLASAEEILYALDTMMSISMTAGYDSVTNAWAVFSDNYGAGKLDLDTSPDAVNYFGPTDKITPIQRAPLPGDFYQTLNLLWQATQMSTFPVALFGMMTGASMAGYAINLLTQSGRRPLIPIWQAIQGMYKIAFRNAMIICREKIAPLLKTDGVPLAVRITSEKGDMDGKGVRHEILLDTKKIGDDFDMAVTLSDPLPQDDAGNLQMALQAWKSGFVSQETALTKWKVVGDAVHEMDRIQMEKFYNQLAQTWMIREAVKKGYVPASAIPQTPGEPTAGEGMSDALELGQGQPGAPAIPQGPPPLGPGMPGVAEAGLQQMGGRSPMMQPFEQQAGVPPPPQNGGSPFG